MILPVPRNGPAIGTQVTTTEPVEAYYSKYAGQPEMWFRPGMIGTVVGYATAVRNTGRGEILCIVDFEAEPHMIQRQDLPTPPWRCALGLAQISLDLEPKQDEKVKTRVTFRRWLSAPYSVIAILWDMPHNPGRVMMYEHVGQHGEGTLDITNRTRLASKSWPGVADLKAELEQRGYELTVVARRPPDWS